jgi:phosphate ABC transporter permease protein PstC
LDFLKKRDDFSKKSPRLWCFFAAFLFITASLACCIFKFKVVIGTNIYVIKIIDFAGPLVFFGFGDTGFVPLFVSLAFAILIFGGILFYKNLVKAAFFCIALSFLFFLSLLFLKFFLRSNVQVYFEGASFYLLFLFLSLSMIFIVFSRGVERAGEVFFGGFAYFCITVITAITCYIFVAGLPAFFEINFKEFLFGQVWSPSNKLYGILPFAVSSLIVTVGSIILGVPIGVFSAVFLAQFAPKKLALTIRIAVRLLAGIPSVVYGFFGMLVIVPLIRSLSGGLVTGDSLLAAILVLSIMILPIVISISEDAIRSVPRAYTEASLALGETYEGTVFKVVLPAAKKGINTAVLLGIGRAIGETMAVIMVSGNVAQIAGLLAPVRFLTTAIALEMSYSSGLHRKALFAIGLILFIFIFLLNSILTFSQKGCENEAKV